MKIVCRRTPDMALLRLDGDLDALVCAAFRSEVERLLGRGIHRIVLNMRRLRFLNSSAIGLLLELARTCRARGGDLVLSEPSEAARHPLACLGLADHFTWYDSDQDAVTGLRRSLERELAAVLP